MKQQAIQYLAFDVHQATVVASLRDERGKVVMRATVHFLLRLRRPNASH